MPSKDTPSTTRQTPGILARAKRLGASTLVAIVPLAAQVDVAATTMTLDYSAVGQSTNSGWFVGVPDESKADGIILPNGFKLWGSETLNDSMFWRYDENYGGLVPRYDFTGTSFVWGGKITGGTTAEDTLSAPFDFSVGFTNGNTANTYTGVSVSLKLGYSYEPRHALEQWQSVNPYNAANYTSYSNYYSEAGTFHETGSLSVNLTDSSSDLYWFAVLSVDWNNEFNSGRWWNGSYQSLNGDTLTVTIPQNSIDVTHIPATPPVSTVPDTGSTVALLGLSCLGLGWLRRRR